MFTKEQCAAFLGTNVETVDEMTRLRVMPRPVQGDDGAEPLWNEWQLTGLRGKSIETPNCLKIVMTDDGPVISELFLKNIQVAEVVYTGPVPERFVERWIKNRLDKIDCELP